jgi:putative ABC transport system permease protein
MRRVVAPIGALVGVGRRSELAAALAVGLVLAVATAVLVAQPRLLRQAETDSLDQALSATPPQWLGLALDLPDLFELTTDGEPTAPVTAAFDELDDSVPADLSALYDEGRFVIDTTRFAVPDVDGEPAPSPIVMTLRLHPDVDDRVEYVEGEPPRPIDEVTDDRMAVMEIAISATTARTLGLGVGSELTMGVSDDALLRRIEGPLPPPFLARVSGVFEPTAATDPYWWGDLRLHRPIVNDTNAGAEYIAYGLFGAEQLATAPFVVDQTTRLQVHQRRELLPGAVGIDNSEGIVQTLRTAVTAGDVGRLGVATGLGQVLINSAERRQTAQTTTLLAIVGMVGATLATCIQFLRVGAARRRTWVALARARGAGTTAVVVAAAIEMAVVAAVAAVAGLLIGALVGGGGLSPSPDEIRLAVLLGFGAVLATALIIAGEARRFGAEASTRSRRWRVFGIGLVLAAGVASVMAYLREGVPPDDPWSNTLATLLPILGPLAAAVAVGLVVPALVGRFTRIGLGLGVGRLVGLRRAASDTGALSGLGLVVTIALTVTGLGLAVDRGLTAGIDDAGWQEVGAPMRVDTRDLEVAAAIGEIGSVTMAPSGVSVVRVESPEIATTVDLINLDVPFHGLLTAGSVADLHLPDLSGADPVPVVAADRLDDRLVEAGDTFAGTGALADTTFVVVETRSEMLGRTEDWLLADRAVMRQVLDREPPVDTLYLDAAPGDADAVAAVASAADAEMFDRAQVVSAATDDPLVRAVRWSYLGTGLLALALIALATVGLVAVTTRARRRDAAVLGLVGSGRGQLLGAARAELMVPVVSATIAGTLLGLVVSRMLDGRLDLSPFTDGLPVAISPAVVLAVGCGLVALVVAAATVAVAVRRTVRVPLGQLLRSEET